MVTVFDVAAYILDRRGEMSAMKLQKLVYYSQAWSMVWTDRPLFLEKIKAWVNGPVVPELYQQHKGIFTVDRKMIQGDPSRLDAEQRDTIDRVLDFYAERSPQWLSDLTHREDPWRNAREGLAPDEIGQREIGLASMMEYYSSLQP